MGKTQIITGVERRRKFKDEEKAALVAEAETSALSPVARKHGISPSILHVWKKKFPPKSFALVEVSEPGSKSSNPVVPSVNQIESPQPPSNMIRVIVQKRIVVEFPLTAEPSAIALFIKALEG